MVVHRGRRAWPVAVVCSPWVRVLAALACVGLVVVPSASGAAEGQRYAWAFPRATAVPGASADRPDEVSGQQLHVVYLVSSDATDERLDQRGVLHDSLLSQNLWFADQSGRQRRMDTHRFDWTDPATSETHTIETPDVTHIDSSKTSSELNTYDKVKDEIEEHRLNENDKRYLVYVTSGTSGLCGQAKDVAVVYLHTDCGNDFATDPLTSGQSDSVAVHEVLHTAYIVGPEAPHYCGDGINTGHVCSTPIHEAMGIGEPDVGYDVLFSDNDLALGDEILDINRDDYFDHDGDWADAADDPLLVAAVLPSVAAVDASVVEGDAGAGELVFAVTLSGMSPYPISVDYTTVDGTATAGADYSAVSGTLEFKPGVVGRQVRVPVHDDPDAEGDETVLVELSGVSDHATLGRARATGMIIDDEPANQPPVAHLDGPVSGDEGQTLVFDASASSDPDGTIVGYAWTLGDGTSASGVQVAHVFANDGVYQVVVTVTDDQGAQDTALNHAPEVVSFLADHNHRLDPRLVLGGPSAISHTVHDQLDTR